MVAPPITVSDTDTPLLRDTYREPVVQWVQYDQRTPVSLKERREDSTPRYPLQPPQEK